VFNEKFIEIMNNLEGKKLISSYEGNDTKKAFHGKKTITDI
jgi:hypothetical protein